MTGTTATAIAPARLPEDIAEIRSLFREYAGLVSEALCFQGFDAELAGLPGAYAPPSGALLVARDSPNFGVVRGMMATIVLVSLVATIALVVWRRRRTD